MPKRRKEFVDDLLTRYEEAIVTCTFLSINFHMVYYKFRINICSSVLATIPKGNPQKKKKKRKGKKRKHVPRHFLALRKTNPYKIGRNLSIKGRDLAKDVFVSSTYRREEIVSFLEIGFCVFMEVTL